MSEKRTPLLRIFTNGIFRENPLLILMIGLCSSLAVTTSVNNGIGMGLSMTFVLLMSELVISLFRKLIPSSIRIPIFIIVIAAFTTVIDYVLKAWFPALSKAMGVFIPLIVVNCIIMGRVEGFASKQPVRRLSGRFPGHGAWLYVGACRHRLSPRAFWQRHDFEFPGDAVKLPACHFLYSAARRLLCFRPVYSP